MNRILASVFLFSTVGCMEHLPDGFEMEGQEVAIQLAHRWWGADNYSRPEPHGPVLFVLPDCRIGAESPTIDGFPDPDTGLCVGGLSLDDGRAWISTRGQGRFSGTSLCHEALHQRIGDQGHHSERWTHVDDCRAFLARQGADDIMGGALKL